MPRGSTGGVGVSGPPGRCWAGRARRNPAALLVLVLVVTAAPGSKSADDDDTVKPNSPPRTALKSQSGGVITVGSTTVPETRNAMRCWELALSKTERFWKCLKNVKKSAGTTVAPGMPYFAPNGPPTPITLFEGDSATLRCTVENKGDNNVVWMKKIPDTIFIYSDNGVLSQNPRYSMDTDNNRTFNLRIDRLTRADQGVYSCMVTTNPQISWNISLMIVSVATVKDIIPLSNGLRQGRRFTFTFNESDVVELLCVGDGSPPPVLRWIGPDGVSVGNTTGQTTGLSFRIDGIRRDQAGQYICKADNGFANDPDFQIVNIRVNYKPVISVIGNEVDVRKPLGDYVQMKCRIDASPEATPSWLKDGVPESTRRISSKKPRQTTNHIMCDGNTSSLVIVNLKAEDYGTYTCQATNLLGTAEANITLSGKPLPPIITSDPVGTRRHVYKLTWTQSDGQLPNQQGSLTVQYYRVLYRGWWRQSTNDRRRVYTIDGENDHLEEMVTPDPGKVQQVCNLHDLRHNATYNLQLYVGNQYGESETVNFTFYTAIEDMPTQSGDEITGPSSFSSRETKPNSDPGTPVGRVWTPESAAPRMAPSTATVLTMVVSLATAWHCMDVYK